MSNQHIIQCINPHFLPCPQVGPETWWGCGGGLLGLILAACPYCPLLFLRQPKCKQEESRARKVLLDSGHCQLASQCLGLARVETRLFLMWTHFSSFFQDSPAGQTARTSPSSADAPLALPRPQGLPSWTGPLSKELTIRFANLLPCTYVGRTLQTT